MAKKTEKQPESPRRKNKIYIQGLKTTERSNKITFPK